MFATKPNVSWTDIKFFGPGVVYGDVSNSGARSPGGKLHYTAHRFSFREDYLAAPLLSLSFKDGSSISVLDPTPRGDTTTAEAKAQTGTALTDAAFQFGALGAHDRKEGGVDFGFWLPGTIEDFAGGARDNANGPLATGTATPSWRRRYHPIKDGFAQAYDLKFRFSKDQKFTQVETDAWRWAWSTLKPPVTYRDIPEMQKVLIDFLETRVVTIDGRSGIPYLLDSRTGEYMDRADARRAAMGFCAKNIEAADQLLQEADKDPSPRGQKMRQSGEAIINTFIRLIPMDPPAGDGFNLFTGKIETAIWSVGKQFLRTPAEEQLVLLHAYQREKSLGRDHPEWLRWSKQYTDWMLTQQRPDGSFPRTWKPGTSDVIDPSDSATYSPPPLLVAYAKQTGDKKYLDAAIRAGDHLWTAYGARGIYAGGAVDASFNELTTDKEAGMLSLEAFLSLYDSTKDPKWLAYARAAADYTETWILIWNVPMPPDADDAELQWKKGIPTVGLQGITVKGSGSQDEYLDWGAPLFAELYKDTQDTHYLDVARILLHDTKAMLAMPGQTFGMLGPGWQQEHWLMSANRGEGQAGKWLPWLVTNHLNSIMGIQNYDPALYKLLITKPAGARNK